ncbi:hypothetical protein SA286_10270 [Bacillus altitudinis]|uniref:hypothetical protein n=1 Tax=Bacillus altitudinis TaxID=293387 RepID=UPI002D78F7BB|nr:hypothetical protein [Bacillus altitudinis]WRO24355.1 hypothetical protein SA286_10270 [Bacillus altitudinis]
MYLNMDKEKIKVASAFVSGENVSAYDEDGNRIVSLEGVNFDNVYLEDDDGQRVEFSQTAPVSQSEIEEMRKLIKTLNDKVLQLEKEGGHGQ